MDFFDTLARNPALFVTLSVVLGLLIGSFLNVVIHRVPIMMDHEMREECAALAAQEAVTPQSPAPPEEPVTVAEAAVGTPEAGAPEVAVAAAAPDPGEPQAAAPQSVEAMQPAAAPRYNLITPGSACPKCRAPITAAQNIPVVSWLVLRGRCANCKAPISARYPLVELATGVLSGFVAWHFGYGGLALAALAFTWFLIALTMIDFDTQYLPDQLTYPLLWLGLLVSLMHPVWAPGADAVSPHDSIIGAAAGYLSLWSVYWLFKFLTGKEGMGYGDFKLLAALGAWLGWQMLLPIVLMASGVGAVFGIVLMIRQRMGRESQMAFGPFLAMAGWLAMIFGHQIVNRYFFVLTTSD